MGDPPNCQREHPQGQARLAAAEVAVEAGLRVQRIARIIIMEAWGMDILRSYLEKAQIHHNNLSSQEHQEATTKVKSSNKKMRSSEGSGR